MSSWCSTDDAQPGAGVQRLRRCALIPAGRRHRFRARICFQQLLVLVVAILFATFPTAAQIPRHTESGLRVSSLGRHVAASEQEAVVRLAPQAPRTGSSPPGASARHALRSSFPVMELPQQPADGNALPIPHRGTTIEPIGPGLPAEIGSAMSSLFRPWWTDGVTRPLRDPESSRPVNVESLVIDALQLSPQIRALSRSPLIQETRIIEADSEFDLRTFMESNFNRPSDPVGNDLVTGGPPRFREEYWNYSAGVRRRNTLGGTVEASQEIGYKHNNSQFFSPREQGLSRLVLSFTQPLLRGSGRDYNTARTVLAEIDAAIANDRFSADLQKQLIRVTRAYWQLFFERASLLQKRQLYADARKILSELEGRQAIDAARSQIMRARSAVAARYSELARAEQSIRNAESRLSALVGYPDFRTMYGLEMVPVDVPSSGQANVSIEGARRTALERRPEMSEALNNVRAASVRVGVSEQDLLPTLDFVAETYVKGLEGRGDIGTAVGQQFSVGEPGYSVGLQFELPWGRRGARSAYDRHRLELQQATSQMDAEAVTVLTEVDVAVGEVQTTFREMQGKYHSMLAAGEDVAYMTERWRMLPGEDRSATLVLEDLLDAQLRAAIEQNNFVQAQVNHMMALVELKRVMGTLLQYEQITIQRASVDCMPDMMISKMPRQ